MALPFNSCLDVWIEQDRQEMNREALYTEAVYSCCDKEYIYFQKDVMYCKSLVLHSFAGEAHLVHRGGRTMSAFPSGSYT